MTFLFEGGEWAGALNINIFNIIAMVTVFSFLVTIVVK
jgi:hypothetical protein